jgi:hypothetical protein
MTGLRSVVGLCLLCALGISAIAASGAAASNGTTAVTCKEKKEPGGKGFSRAHCSAADAVTEGAKYEHVAIAEETATKVKATNANTSGETTGSTTVKLQSTQSGTPLELQATGWEGTGSMFNTKDPETGEHYVQEEGTVTFTGVTVTKPAGKGCEVEGGSIKTNQLSVTSQEQGMALKFVPKFAEPFASFNMKGCSTGALNGLYEIKGSLLGHPDGAVVTFVHSEVTAQGTLSMRGQKCGLEGTVTISGKDEAAGDASFTALSITTVETP